MIKDIAYPSTEEEWHVKGTYVIDGNEMYFEIPGTFVDGVLDQTTTEQTVNDHIKIMADRYEKITSQNS